MPNRNRQNRNKAPYWRQETLARMCAMLALTDALYLLRMRPMASSLDDITGLNLTWDSVLALALIGLMMMALPKRG